MSFILRDPFFDGFEDMMSSNWPFTNQRSFPFAVEDDNHDNHDNLDNHGNNHVAKRIRRDVITPFSGFGRMDMKEMEKQYELSVDIPGMRKEDIKITKENNMLVIEGERRQESKQTKKTDDNNKYHFMERHYGKFRRELSIPANASADLINATYENGVLKVSIPKAQNPINKKVIAIE